MLESQEKKRYFATTITLLSCPRVQRFTEVGTKSDIRDERYRTEPDIGSSDIAVRRAGVRLMSFIGLNFVSITDIRLHVRVRVRIRVRVPVLDMDKDVDMDIDIDNRQSTLARDTDTDLDNGHGQQTLAPDMDTDMGII
jgi:hypothetical protein